MKTDIEIAQECTMEPITAIAEKAGIPDEYEGLEISRWDYLYSTLYDNVVIKQIFRKRGTFYGITDSI